jgi:pheromone shutdown protein TraB
MGLNECSTSGGKGDMRPTAVTVIGIIGIVLGILGLCCNIVGIVGAGSLPMLAEMAQQSGEQSPELQQMLNNPALMRYTMVSAVVGLVLSVWMIVASILLLGMKPIGYTLMLSNAVVLLLWAIVSTIAGIAIVGADATSFIGVPIQIAFPVAVLVVLTRPNIKEAFQSSGF